MRFATLPRLYPILDAGVLERAGLSIESFAVSLREAGVRFLQYRDKEATDQQVRERAKRLREIFPYADSCLILNDRASLVIEVGFDGVHVGQQDLSPAQTRARVGPTSLIGLSTHTPDQWLQAATTTTSAALVIPTEATRMGRAAEGPAFLSQPLEADYVAVGPIFATNTKHDAEPVVGLEGVRAARSDLQMPLVAIGGITRKNCASVFAAGADSVAVISDLIPHPGATVAKIIADFHAILG